MLDITKLYLERNGEFSVEIVNSAQKAIEILREHPFDAIVSDYQMPEMDGIEFLIKVRASGNTIPFIIFTGKGREEVVIRAMNEGADFYLQKGGDAKAQFAELVHKIRQAVQQRRAERHIRDLELREADILNFLPDATFAIDTHGTVIAWNRAMEQITGINAAEILGKGDYTYAVPFYRKRRPILIDLILGDDPEAAEHYPFIIRDGKKLISETLIPHFNDGNGAYLWFTASPLYDTKGMVAGAIESIRDVTQRKQAEDELHSTNEELRTAYEQLTAAEEELRQNYDELSRNEQALHSSEERYRNVVEDQTEFISRFLPDGTHVFVNEAYCRYFGFTRDAILGHRFKPEIPAGDRVHLKQFFAALTTAHPVDSIDHRIIMPDGKIRWQRWSDRAIFDASGNVTEYQSVGRDITETKQAEEALREGEERYRNVVEDQTEFISRFLPDGTHVFVNEAYCRYFSKNREEIIGKRFIPDIPEADRALVRQHFASLTWEHPVATVTHRIILPDGRIQWQQWSDRAIFDASGNVFEYQSVGRDVTQLKQAEEELRRKNVELHAAYEQLTGVEEELRTNYDELIKSQQEIHEREQFISEVVRGVQEGIVVYDRGLRITLWNRFMEGLTGLPASTVLGKNAIELFPFHKETGVARLLEEALAGSTGESNDFPFLIKSTGRMGWAKGLYSPHYDATGKIIGVIAVVRDITKRKETEDALRKGERKFRMLFELIPDPAFLIDQESGRILDVNTAVLKEYGYTKEEITQLKSTDISAESEKTADDFQDAIAFTPIRYHQRRDGTVFPVEISRTFVELEGRHTIFTTVRNITESKRVEETLRERAVTRANRKLNLMIEITRHDIVNQLLALTMCMDLARSLAEDPKVDDYFVRSENAIRTIRTQLSFTRDYQSIGIKAPEWQSVSGIISRVRQAFLLADSMVVCTCDDLEVLADLLMEKVFYNLIDNAFKYGGNRLSSIRIFFLRDAADGSLTIVCEDDGIGISPEDQQKLFNRGFGKNTGLGLFLAREILSITGITITETGEQGKGARFEIKVPEGAWRFPKVQH
jgi:PAS domain S-box-containing protein